MYSMVLNFVPHETTKPRYNDMHACHKMMDLMSLVTFLGQSSTIKNDTFAKTRLDGVNRQN
jgi:hypothetical protein